MSSNQVQWLQVLATPPRQTRYKLLVYWCVKFISTCICYCRAVVLSPHYTYQSWQHGKLMVRTFSLVLQVVAQLGVDFNIYP